jgi:hypothetical protein
MYKFQVFAMYCVICCLAAPAKAASDGNNWYTGISGDITWPNHANTGGGGNAALGYRFAPSNSGNFRLEGEAGYHAANGNSGFGDLHYFNYMGNAYYDFFKFSKRSESRWHLNPYIGGGLGVTSIHTGKGGFSVTFNHHTNAFAYQGMAGLSFDDVDTPNMQWIIGYRYQGSESVNGIKLHANNVEVGLRYHF